MKAKIRATGEIINVRKVITNIGDELYEPIRLEWSNVKFKASELDFLSGKETVVLEGWLTRSTSEELILSDSPECKRGGCVWYHKEGSNVISMSELGLFSNDIFPSVTWQSEPKKVRLIIEEIEE